MREFYNTNKDFRDYVEKYRRDHDLTVEQALEDSTVRNVAVYYREMEGNKVEASNH